jgi:hypothetical protein
VLSGLLGGWERHNEKLGSKNHSVDKQLKPESVVSLLLSYQRGQLPMSEQMSKQKKYTAFLSYAAPDKELAKTLDLLFSSVNETTYFALHYRTLF